MTYFENCKSFRVALIRLGYADQPSSFRHYGIGSESHHGDATISN